MDWDSFMIGLISAYTIQLAVFAGVIIFHLLTGKKGVPAVVNYLLKYLKAD